jgi:hypothetical protein
MNGLNGSASRGRFRPVVYMLACAVVLVGACGGKSSEDDGNDTSGKGGATGATGGTSAATGGAGDTSTGGSANQGNGSGGSDIPSKGGTSGSTDPGKGGSGAAPDCSGVLCGPIPTTCKEIVQEPGKCCPICTDTGCEKCPDLDCEDGTHAETVPGDCCPSCLMNPPDACETGQQAYQQMRETLLDKYGSVGCMNSTECTLVQEDNACVVSCPVVLPTATASSYIDNLNSSAAGCATCDVPLPSPCPASGPAACVNGKCAMAAVSE